MPAKKIDKKKLKEASTKPNKKKTLAAKEVKKATKNISNIISKGGKSKVGSVIATVSKLAKSVRESAKVGAEKKITKGKKSIPPVPLKGIAKKKKNNNLPAKAQFAKPVLAKELKTAPVTKGELDKVKATKIQSEKKTSEKSQKLSAADRLKNRCRESGCEQEAVLSGYCRLHYIKNWRRIKKKENILAGGQLDLYVEELVAKYPDKYLDAIENDLSSEKEWIKVITDLELSAADDDFTPEDEESMVPEAASRRSPSFDDENDDIY